MAARFGARTMTPTDDEKAAQNQKPQSVWPPELLIDDPFRQGLIDISATHCRSACDLFIGQMRLIEPQLRARAGEGSGAAYRLLMMMRGAQAFANLYDGLERDCIAAEQAAKL